MTAIITSENAQQWATVYYMINLINSLQSVDDFYGAVEPTIGMGEIYERLRGWRKQTFRNFIMSGDFVMDRFGKDWCVSKASWNYGRYNTHPDRCDVRVRKYPEHAMGWEDFVEEARTMSWQQICGLYAI